MLVLTSVGMGIKSLCKSIIFGNFAIVRASTSLRRVCAWKSRSKKGLGPPAPHTSQKRSNLYDNSNVTGVHRDSAVSEGVVTVCFVVCRHRYLDYTPKTNGNGCPTRLKRTFTNNVR